MALLISSHFFLKNVPECRFRLSTMNLANPRVIKFSGHFHQGLCVSKCCRRLEFRRSYARATFKPALVDEPETGKQLSPFAGLEIPKDISSKRHKWEFSLPYPSLNNYQKASMN
jgi:hypothetical protein